MWQALGDADRCAVRRRFAALRDPARRGREARSRRATTSPSSRPSAPTRRRRSTTAASCTRRRSALAACRHPLVAQIHGICVGGGLEIAALCDLRICGESSRFGAPIKNLGLVMAYPEMAPLVRLAGPDVALEILLEGRIFGAAEAKEKRLVTRVVPDAEVAAEVAGDRAAHRRGRAARRALAQEVRAPARRIAADHRGRIRRVLRLLRHRGLPDRLRRRSWRRRSPSSSADRRDARRSRRARTPGPLAGMRVLELAQIMAGPTCGMMLADLGADVIKVEKLPGGDDSRGYREPRVNGVSAPFLMMNRNKRGIAVDLKHPQGRGDPAAARPRHRRADRELPPRHAGEAGPRLRRAGGDQSRAHLLRDHRLRPRRPAVGQGRLRPDGAGVRRTDGDHRRARTPSRQERQSGRRRQRGHPRRCRDRRRVRAQAPDRPWPARRHVAAGSRAAADVLARGDPLRDRRIPGAGRIGASPHRALPGVSRQRRLDQHRRREPAELGADHRRAGASRVARRPALRDQFGAHGEPRRADVAR